MPLNLTKEEVANLTTEQQETLARVALDDARRSRAMLARARGRFGFSWIPTVLVIAVAGLVIWMPDLPTVMPYMLLALAVLVQFHASVLNRRIDALIETLELDKVADLGGSNQAEDEERNPENR